MKIKWKALMLALFIPLALGSLAGVLAGDSMGTYGDFVQPPLAVPGFLFPIVWTVLYALMGVSSYLVYVADVEKKQKQKALWLYAIQLFVNLLWSVFFFNLSLYLFSFIWLLLLWVLILLTMRKFASLSKPACFLLLPYLLWVSFAGYLNLSIAILNE